MGFPELVEIHPDAVGADQRLAHFRVGSRFTPNPAVGSLLAFKLTGNPLPAATILKMAGIPDQAIHKLLGHASVGTAREIYLHLTPDAEKGAAEKMDEIFGPVAVQNIKTRPS
jgi:hypothetical protein